MSTAIIDVAPTCRRSVIPTRGGTLSEWAAARVGIESLLASAELFALAEKRDDNGVVKMTYISPILLGEKRET